MANGNDGFGKLLVGGGLAWLVWQYFQTNGGVGAGGGTCPPNAVQVRLSNGQMQCVPASQLGGGGLSVGQTISLVGGLVGTVVAIGAQVAAAIAKATASAAGTGAGAGAATATATVTTTTGIATQTTATVTADTAADIGADVASEVIALGLDASLTTALGYMAILYAAAELTTLLAQWIGGIANNRARADRKAPTNFDDVLYNEQAAFSAFVGQLSTSLNTKIQTVAAKTGQAPVYPDLNKQQALPQAVSGYLSGYSGRTRGGRGGGRFGAAMLRQPSRGVQSPVLAPRITTVLPPVQQNIASLLASAAATASKTPYSSESAFYTGGHNELGATGAWCAGAGTYCYYLTSLDPRLPVGMLRDFRALLRWMFWVQEREYNSTMRQYWQSRMAAEGSIPECGKFSSALDCLNAFTVDESKFDAALSAYYRAIPPTELLPAGYQSFTTFVELNATVLLYLQNMNTLAASAGAPQIGFDALTKSVEFNGVAQAVCAAAQIGFGSWASGYPMHFVDGVWQADNEAFCNAIRVACGLTSWSPASSTFVVNGFGQTPTPRWLIQDPVTGWFIDVVASRERGIPVCYKFQPAGQYPVGPNGPPVAWPDEYVPLGYYGRGRGGRGRRKHQLGYVVPLSPAERGGFMDVLARGFSL